jgi:hypothetical protein
MKFSDGAHVKLVFMTALGRLSLSNKNSRQSHHARCPLGVGFFWSAARSNGPLPAFKSRSGSRIR